MPLSSIMNHADMASVKSYTVVTLVDMSSYATKYNLFLDSTNYKKGTIKK